MEKVNFIIKKVAIMMGNGKIIICMVSEGFTTQIINLLMKDIGLLINSMEKEKFIMMNLHIFKILLTIKILIIWNKNGNIMKEIQYLILNKVQGNQFYQMMNITKVNLKMIEWMAKVGSSPKMDKL